ncbi:hypothetical protein TESG_08451 [Trichophyton tonsurans CBS 112818]|uniref:Uncharacterized protein n=1 Tax=Trichophyton tonsurans (strain CBS 112818) TaxID=647933 RepID=F2RZ77_TRIT1|nr:hypothetical protein TESG_08451 [Trichophyton tonsurans CBS 112818]
MNNVPPVGVCTSFMIIYGVCVDIKKKVGLHVDAQLAIQDDKKENKTACMMPQGKKRSKLSERKPAWLPGFLAKGRNKKATTPLRPNPKKPQAHTGKTCRRKKYLLNVLRLRSTRGSEGISNKKLPCFGRRVRTPGWQITCSGYGHGKLTTKIWECSSQGLAGIPALES